MRQNYVGPRDRRWAVPARACQSPAPGGRAAGMWKDGAPMGAASVGHFECEGVGYGGGRRLLQDDDIQGVIPADRQCAGKRRLAHV